MDERVDDQRSVGDKGPADAVPLVRRFRRSPVTGGGRMSYIAEELEDRLGLSALPVRPDGMGAWVSETTGDDERLPQAVSRWMGEP